jgi:carboxylesterase
MSQNRAPVLLLHGITASPGQLASQKEALCDAGYTTAAPLYAGHGTHVDDMQHYRWEDWYADVLRAATALLTKPHARQLDCVGLSFGALLGLKLALDRPDIVRRMVCIATPLVFYRWVDWLHPLLRWTPLRLLRNWPKDFTQAVADPEGRAIYRSVSYDCFPIQSVVEIRRLQHEVRPHLESITQPLLLIHAHQDRSAPPVSSQEIAARVTGPCETLWLDRSRHVCTLDYDRELINERILEFVNGVRS